MAVPYPDEDQSGPGAEASMDERLFIQPGPAPTTINQRHETHFKNARRHSTIVGLLKRVLPVVAVGFVIWFVIAGFLNTKDISNISFESTGISNGMLLMDSPKLSGFNRDNKPYDLVASRAKQDLKKPGVIELENLHATVPMQEGLFADIIAKSGIYNSAKEWLSLKHEIEINSQDGTKIKLDSAEIDLSKGTLSSTNPVFISTKNAKISADQVEVSNNGEVIIFKQHVKMTILPAQDLK